jgi:thioredoxin-dependent peroxiredoxin
MGMQIIGCSADSQQKQTKFVEKHGFQFPMLCDQSHQMLEDYGVWQLKKFMGREYMGIVRSTYIIDEKGFIETIFVKVKTKSHALDILTL